MKKIVEQVLQTEELARAAVESARSRADSIIADAKKEAALLVDAASANARQAASRQHDEVLAAVVSEKERVLIDVRRQYKELRSKKEGSIAETARAIFTELVTVRQ